VPAVGPALDKFGRWAGLFMQVAGLIEALRRLIRNPLNAFTITPAAPTVTFSGSGPMTLGKPKSKNVQRLDDLQHATVVTEVDPLEYYESPEELAHRTETLMGIEGVVEAHTVDNYVRSPKTAQQIMDALSKFIHKQPGGEFDDIANAKDPLARRAVALYWTVDSMFEEACHILSPNVTEEDVFLQVIEAENRDG